jgi:hypothetical protein
MDLSLAFGIFGRPVNSELTLLTQKPSHTDDI